MVLNPTTWFRQQQIVRRFLKAPPRVFERVFREIRAPPSVQPGWHTAIVMRRELSRRGGPLAELRTRGLVECECPSRRLARLGEGFVGCGRRVLRHREDAVAPGRFEAVGNVEVETMAWRCGQQFMRVLEMQHATMC